MKFWVICDKCHHKQKYQSKGSPYKKSKKCVYCGKYFTIKSDKTDNIVREIK